MKKVISIFLILVMFAGIWVNSFPVSATENLTGINSEKIISMYPQVSQDIKEAVENHEDTVNLKKYNLTEPVVYEIYKAVLFENPQLFYAVATGMYYSVNNMGMILSIRPYYVFEKDELPEATKKFNSAVEYFLSGVDPNWSDLEKCLYIHDILVTQREYDSDATTHFNYILSTAYSAMVNNESICQGYSLAYNYLLGKLGIKAYFIVDDSKTHGWSLVKLGDNYYHVDLTWADPLFDVTGGVVRSYCFISDSKMLEIRPYITWEYDLKATDTTYDRSWWRNTRSSIYTIDNKQYYIDATYKTGNGGYGALMCYDKETDTHEIIYEIGEYWYSNSQHSSFWSVCFSRLAYDGKKFYFNTSDAVYSVNKDGSGLEIFYERTDLQDLQIYGLAFQSDGGLYCEYRNIYGSVNTEGTVYRIDKSENAYQPGDLNNDGILSVRDATILQLYLSQSISLDLKRRALADFSYDGTVSINDVTAIQKKIANVK